MKETLLRCMSLFIIFYMAATCLMYVDNICYETTGEGGKLVLDIDNLTFFH